MSTEPEEKRVETSRYRSDASLNFMESMKELLGHNPHAIEAISSRNHRIQELKDIIAHQNIAFDEIEERYDALAQEKIDNEKKCKEIETRYKDLEANYLAAYESEKELRAKLVEMETEFTVAKRLNQRSLTYKVEQYANKLDNWRGALIKLLLTPPMSTILILCVWIVLIIASIYGWGGIWEFIKPIYDALAS